MSRTTSGVCVFAAGLSIACAAGAVPSATQPEAADAKPEIVDPPAPAGASAYRLVPAGEGLILSWLEPGERGKRLVWSRLTEAGWSDPGVVTEQRDGMVANWADVPAVVEGGDGAMYAHWLRESGPGPAAYDIVVHRSADGGSTWAELGKLNDDDVQAEHGFVSYVPVADGVRAFWLDGRERPGGHHEGEHEGRTTLRAAAVGETIGPSELLDGMVCDCCNTAAAATPDGPIVAYRDRSESEVRDISMAGAGVEAVRTVHEDGWMMPGCPVNGPAMAAAGERVIFAWFTGAPTVRVNAAFSEDGGVTFSDPVVVDEAQGASVPLGRVDVVLDGEGAVVCWLRNEQREGVLLARRVGADGALGEPVRVAPMDGSRPSGFPQMEALGRRIIVVWRDIDRERLRTAVLDRARLGG